MAKVAPHTAVLTNCGSLIFLPILIFWLLDYFIGFEAGLIGLSGLGILGLLLRSSLMKYIAGVYQKRKYAMINGFKQTGE